MKKPIQLLTILTLSFTLLLSSATLANTVTKQIILHVNSCNYDQYTNLYITSALDENGELYIIESHDNISEQWLDATINQSYEITDYTIMK
jgi:hypothetical protein